MWISKYQPNSIHHAIPCRARPAVLQASTSNACERDKKEKKKQMLSKAGRSAARVCKDRAPF